MSGSFGVGPFQIGPLKDIEALKNIGVDVIPRIPGLAEGGVVRQETLAVIGERGDEAVLPLRPEVLDRAFPALDQLVQIAARVERVLTNGIQVEMKGGPTEDRFSALSGSVGLEGMGAW